MTDGNKKLRYHPNGSLSPNAAPYVYKFFVLNSSR